MTHNIQRVARNAIKLFRREVGKKLISKGELEDLKNSVSSITSQDVCVDESFLRRQGIYKANHNGAPVTYVQIYQDDDVNICVFILKAGVKLPLHDHPEMHGLLKVIHGSVKVKSFSMQESSGHPTQNDFKNCVQEAIKHPGFKVTEADPACLLLPGINNIHEISSIDGPAAFLDILSPPYGTDKKQGGERDCHYYQEISVNLDSSKNDDSLCYLLRIPAPNDFWCDQADYEGPPVEGVLST